MEGEVTLVDALEQNLEVQQSAVDGIALVHGSGIMKPGQASGHRRKESYADLQIPVPTET